MKVRTITPVKYESVEMEVPKLGVWVYNRYESGEWTEVTGDMEEIVLDDKELELAYKNYKKALAKDIIDNWNNMRGEVIFA